MSLKFKDPTHNRTLIIITPIETSYDTICAADLIAPKKGYFEFATESREQLYYTKEKLLENGDRWENILAANIKADSSHR